MVLAKSKYEKDLEYRKTPMGKILWWFGEKHMAIVPTDGEPIPKLPHEIIKEVARNIDQVAIDCNRER